MKYLQKISSPSEIQQDLEYGVVYYDYNNNEVIIKEKKKTEFKITFYIKEDYYIGNYQNGQPTKFSLFTLDTSWDSFKIIKSSNDKIVYDKNEGELYIQLDENDYYRKDDYYYTTKNFSGEYAITYTLNEGTENFYLNTEWSAHIIKTLEVPNTITSFYLREYAFYRNDEEDEYYDIGVYGDIYFNGSEEEWRNLTSIYDDQWNEEVTEETSINDVWASCRVHLKNNKILIWATGYPYPS